jgi:uncharacterized membrane protein YgaE (UPF0421/DUF939 family)
MAAANDEANDSLDNPRASLRQSSFIDPSTGQRLSRTFTLHDVSHHINETTPLLYRTLEANDADSGYDSLVAKARGWANRTAQFATSEQGKAIFKCALAYILASLATFIPVLSNLFGAQTSKHMIATMTVYFPPARSLGSLLDAVRRATTAFLYVAVVAFLSMSVMVLFADKIEIIELGHAIVLVVFIGGAFGFMAWVKVRMDDPLVNISVSLASLSLISILTKEGSVQRGDYSITSIIQILNMVAAGILITAVVSLTVFPVGARQKLRKNLLDTTDSLADILALIASSFLTGDESELEDSVLQQITEKHTKLSSTIMQNLKESRYEHYLLGTERLAAIESKLATCIQRISQSIGGLRSAAAMQFVVVKQPAFSSKQVSSITPSSAAGQTKNTSGIIRSEQDVQEHFANPSSAQPPFRTPAQIFELFIRNLGPAMRSLAFTLKEILDDFPFDASDGYKVATNPKFRLSLDRALEMYTESRKDALMVVYGQKDMNRARPIPVEADWEDAAACCGHFSFSLVEVAESVRDYLITLDELQLEVDECPAGRTWRWLNFWEQKQDQDRVDSLDPDFVAQISTIDSHNRPRTCDYLRIDDNHETPKWPDASQVKQVCLKKLYAVASVLRRDDTRFAIKVGMGAIIYALPSFITATRPIYEHWRGDWGLVSYMVVCSMTIGASNTSGWSRLVGTCIGGVLGILAWEVSRGNAFVLGIVSFAVAYYTAYILVVDGNGPMCRFIVLTYNIIALYAYSLSSFDDPEDSDEEDSGRNPLILPIAGHRVVAVVSGILWGLFITRAIWPISARQKVKDGLALLWLRMGLIWKRDPLSTLLEGVHPDRYMNLQEELYLQHFLTKLRGLAEASKREFELRRPFPHASYLRLLNITEQMLGAFHAMNEVLMKDMKASPGEEALLKATIEERFQLCGRISHLFNVLASSMKLEFAITSKTMPSIDSSRDKLLARVFEYRKEDVQEQQTKDEDYSLLYTYALVTGQLNLGVQDALQEVENLFGVLDEEALRLQ